MIASPPRREARPMPPAENKVPSAADLRKMQLEREMEEMSREAKLREEETARRARFAEDFLGRHVDDEEREMIGRIVMAAVKDGKFEALVYTFPSELTTDGGRAINSNRPDWPDTLQGKARELYEGYLARARPQGYKLRAMIVNFPGGVPGDVGFYLNWAPETPA
jgi:hypothetical protein